MKNGKFLVIEAYHDGGRNYNHTVAMAFDNGKIVGFIRQPNDYSSKDFIEEIEDSYADYEILINPYGAGACYLDEMNVNRTVYIGEFRRPNTLIAWSRYFNINKIDETIWSMIDCSVNKKMSIDLRILKEQLMNLEPHHTKNGLILRRIERCIDSGFAYCVLHYMAYVNGLFV